MRTKKAFKQAEKKAEKKAAKKAAQKASKQAPEKDTEMGPEEFQEELAEEKPESPNEKTSEEIVEKVSEDLAEKVHVTPIETTGEKVSEITDEKASESPNKEAAENAGNKPAEDTSPGIPTEVSLHASKNNTKAKKKRKSKAAKKAAKKAAQNAAEVTEEDPEPPLFSIQDIPGKGRGLVAACDVPWGTRILAEKPLLMSGMSNAALFERHLIRQVNALSSVERTQFLALHDNFPDDIGYSGIFKTNGLPCGEDSNIGAVYPTISLINHSCIPNAFHSWNFDTEEETVHAIRPISAGEEITIAYTESDWSFSTRQEYLKSKFGFDCKCPICDLPEEDLKASDDRRNKLDILGKLAIRMARISPDRSLRFCYDLYVELHKEFRGYPGGLLSKVYYDAFLLTHADGDAVRAKIFAERTHAMRFICEGTDSKNVMDMVDYVEDPREMDGFGRYADPATKERWHTKPPGVEGSAEFEQWLWHQEKK